MKNSSDWRGRWDLISRLSLHHELRSRVASRSPAVFRQLVRIGRDSDLRLGAVVQPWQEADFRALDPAWRVLAGQTTEGCDFRQPVWRAYIERPRGHAKTADMAVQILWILLHAPYRLQGLAAAADREQASLLRSAIHLLGELNPELCGRLQFRQHAIFNGMTGSKLEIISSDVQSSWGALPDFVICDELCHWEKPELWYSLFSSAAKRPRCLLAVLTNAGVGRGWQWELREAARRSATWYFSSLAGPVAPWITAENLEEQRRLLPGHVYDRLWRNLWQEAGGEFVTWSEVLGCRDDTLRPRSQGEPHVHYVAAIDYAEKRDDTVGVVVHREGENIVVDRMDVVRPTAERPTLVSWVENWIVTTARKFRHITFILDEYQLLGTLQKFAGTYDLRRFEFLGGQGNHALALRLRQLIVERKLRWFPGCGAIESPAGRDDLETELASLLLKQSASGRCRIDHVADGKHHDDRAFALGAACLHAGEQPSTGDWLQVTSPVREGEFAW